jgi:hypothetical protein
VVNGVVIVLNAISEEDKQLFDQVAENSRAVRFWLGDKANEYKAVIRAGGLPGAQVMDVYAAIAQLVKYEYKPSSIELFSRIAEVYSEAERSQYEILPFSHLALACRFGKRKHGVLQLSLNYLEERGRLPSETWLESAAASAAYDDRAAELAELPMLFERSGNDGAGTGYAVYDDDFSEQGERRGEWAALAGLASTLRMARSVVERLGIESGLQQRLLDLLRSLEAVLQEAMQELKV